MSAKEKGKAKGMNAFKKSALVVMATTRASNKRSKTPKLHRQASGDAMDVLTTFVDESVDNSPMTALARDKCGIRDAMMLEG